MRWLAALILVSTLPASSATAQLEVTDSELRARCDALAKGLASAPGSGAEGTKRADVVLRASVRATSVRFATRPHALVLTAGCPGVDSVRVVERRNLPEPIVPGITYRDVYVVLEIFAHLTVSCPVSATAPASAAAVVALGCDRQPSSDSIGTADPRRPPH